MIKKDVIDMTGRTHVNMALLCSSYSWKINPINLIYIPYLILGALIPDVDNEYSLIQSYLYIFIYSVFSIFILYHNDFNYLTIIGITLFIGLSIICKKYMNHRTLTHSILGLILYSIPVWLISHSGAIYFIVGCVIHVSLDLFDTRGVRVMYPSEKIFKIKSLKLNKISDYSLRLVSVLLILYILII